MPNNRTLKMTDLIAVQRIAGWEKLKALVLDSVSSPITKRVNNMALDEFMGWFQQAPRPPAEAQFGFLLGVPTLPATGSAQGRQLAHAAPHPRVVTAGGWSGLGDGFGTAGPRFGTRDGRHLFARASPPGSRGP